jgi:hypothetical protein
MLMMALSNIGGFLKGVPREVWYIILALVVVLGAYHKGSSDKDNEWEARMEKAADQARIDSIDAAVSADEGAAVREEKFDAQEKALVEIIEDAKASGNNPLDALFGGL